MISDIVVNIALYSVIGLGLIMATLGIVAIINPVWFGNHKSHIFGPIIRFVMGYKGSDDGQQR